MNEEIHPSESLARFAACFPAGTMPPEVMHEARRSLVNYFATALAGSRDPAIEKTRAVLDMFAGPPEGRQIGRGEPVDIPTAALLNAAAANVHDFDDTHIPTIIHPTAPVAAALFAWADSTTISGAALLEALAIGIEVECVIGNAISPFHYARGWHITSTCGVFGAAAATGRLLGLNETQMVWAFGTASALASGLVHTLGTMSKSIGVGSSARHGLLAALFAREGVSGPALPFEGPRGFLSMFGDGEAGTPAVAMPGEDWQILRNTYKPYPSGVVLNPVIDACLELREQAAIESGSIVSVNVFGNPLLCQRTDRSNVQTGRESQVSAQHAVAVTLLRGKPSLPAFSDAAVADAENRALADRVSVIEDDTIPAGAARVEINMSDGSAREAMITEATGGLEKPLTDDELERKLKSLAEPVLTSRQSDALARALWQLDATADASAVMEAACGR